MLSINKKLSFRTFLSLCFLVMLITFLPAQEQNQNQNQKQKQVNEALQVSASETAGDPVRITTGAYEQTEVDIVKENVQNLLVRRVYLSSHEIIGSFGMGWSSNLDERIVLGTAPDLTELYAKHQQMDKLLKDSIAEYEEEIKKTYEVEDPYNVIEDLNATLVRLDEIVEEINGIKASLQEIIDSSGPDSLTAQDLYKDLEECDELIQITLDKKPEFVKAIASAEKALSELNELQSQLQKNQEEMEAVEERMRITKERKERNQKVMFRGMESFFEETGINTITYVDNEGYPHLMQENENYSNVWLPKSNDMACVFENNRYTLITNSAKKSFDYNGFIILETDYYGNTIEYIRDENEKIKYIKSSFGESFAVEYENDFIKSITNERDPSENVLYYYEGDRMTGNKDTDGDYVSIGYDKHGLINALGKNDGSTYRIIYDDQLSEGEVLATQLVNEEGKAQRFEYNRKDKITAFIDRDGWKTVYHYDKNHRTTKLENYDPKGNRILNTEEDQNQKQYIWNEDGSILECRDNEGTVYRTLHNSRGQAIRYVDCRKGKEIIHDYEYDDFGNIKKDSIKNNVKEMEYDSRNRLIKLSQNGKLLSTYEYGKNGKIYQIIYSNGLVMEIEYNGRKDLTAIRFTDKNSGKSIITEVEYDHHHTPLRVYKTEGNKRELKKTFTYTDEGWLLSSETEGVKKTFDGYDKQELTFEDIWDLPDISDRDNNTEIYKDEKGIEVLRQKLF